MFAYPFTQKLKELVVAAGDFVENAIGNKIEGSDKEAPELTGVPEEKVWYKLTLEAGIAADGSPYHIYLKKGKTRQLCIFFSGGGVAWDDYSAVVCSDDFGVYYGYGLYRTAVTLGIYEITHLEWLENQDHDAACKV